MTLQSFLIKTKGWLRTSGTYAVIRANADWYDWCPDGTFAWAASLIDCGSCYGLEFCCGQFGSSPEVVNLTPPGKVV